MSHGYCAKNLEVLFSVGLCIALWFVFGIPTPVKTLLFCMLVHCLMEAEFQGMKT